MGRMGRNGRLIFYKEIFYKKVLNNCFLRKIKI